jgi:hypothetical protein
MQPTKRRLTDLWVVGRELTLDDGGGDPITVWIQKLNSAEANEANRKCDAARARVIAGRADEDSDGWRAIQGSVRDYAQGNIEVLVEFLLMEERNKIARSVEARVAAEEEWSKDNLLQGLRDAWNDDLERRWLEDDTHEADMEATRCKEELDRFVAQMTEIVDNEVEVIHDAWAHQSVGELELRMGLRLLDIEGNQAWMKELYSCQIYFGTRHPDRKKVRYFESRDEVDTLSLEAYAALHNAFDTLEVDAAEGKDLPAPTDSSPSSEAQGEAETEPVSGPVGAVL